MGVAVLHQLCHRAAGSRTSSPHDGRGSNSGSFKRFGALASARGQCRAIPFEIKPLPSGPKKELKPQSLYLSAALIWPSRELSTPAPSSRMVCQLSRSTFRFGQRILRQDGLVRHRREHVHRDVVGRLDGEWSVNCRKISAAPCRKMHGDGGGQKGPDHKELR